MTTTRHLAWLSRYRICRGPHDNTCHLIWKAHYGICKSIPWQPLAFASDWLITVFARIVHNNNLSLKWFAHCRIRKNTSCDLLNTVFSRILHDSNSSSYDLLINVFARILHDNNSSSYLICSLLHSRGYFMTTTPLLIWLSLIVSARILHDNISSSNWLSHYRIRKNTTRQQLIFLFARPSLPYSQEYLTTTAEVL